MDMFNKFKETFSSSVTNTIQNTVYSTGNIISGVIPGNPVTREYEVIQHIGSAGPGLLWKVFSAVKKSSRQPASVFVLERAQLDKFDRQDREIIWELVKKGVSQLTRLRHPQILTVEHPLEESRDCLAFATEPVLASLANVIGWHENIPSPPPKALTAFKLFPVEIKYGILQICEGLQFLHGSARMLHRNLSPESILVNSQGAWKIAGFDYVLSSTPGGQGVPDWECPEYDQGVPAESYPHLDYSAPELALLGTVTPAADMFSLGMLIFCVYNRRSLYHCDRNWGAYKRNVSDLRTIPADRLQKIPPDLVDYIKLLLSSTPDLRPTPEEVQQLQFFQDVGVKTLQLLDSQFQWDNLQKSQFYKGLPSVLPQLPQRVSLHRVYPCLAKEFVNSSMVPFVLPPAIQIAKDTSSEDFAHHMLPALKPVMKIMDPIQVLLIFMQNMELLLEKTPKDDVKSDVLPMLYRALECDVSQIQELCLAILPEFAGLLDRQSLKTAFIPRIKKVCISTRLLSVRVNSLICLAKLLEYLDKWQVIDEVLPMLSQIPSREPAVVMGIVGIYKITLTSTKLGLTKEVMASKALPFLVPLSIENGLTVAQYDIICELIRDMMKRIECEHRVKLEQLNSIQQETQRSLQVGLPAGQLVAAPSLSQTSEMDSMFSGLGLDSFINKDRSGGSLAEDPNKPDGFPANQTKPSQTKPNQTTSLSLQEKQRILQQQEQLRDRSRTGLSSAGTGLTSSGTGLIKPPTVGQTARNVSPKPASDGVKDLTDSLIKKSLSMNQFQQNSGALTGHNMGLPTSNNMGLSTSSSMSFSSSNNNFSSASNFNTASTTAGFNTFPANTSQRPTMGAMASNNSFNPAGQQSGMSSLDNLFPAAKPKTPMMNIMQPQNSGFLQPTPSTTTTTTSRGGASTKPLSQSDIKDLLG